MVNLCLQCYGGRIIDNLQIDNVKLITQTYKLMTQTYKLILYFYLSGSTKVLNMDPIWIRIQNIDSRSKLCWVIKLLSKVKEE